MNCNLKIARPRAPKEWERLPDRDKHIIIQYLKDKVMEELEQTNADRRDGAYCVQCHNDMGI